MNGFTLAELIVAAAIASLAILILVAVLRKGTEISDTTKHRQRARAIIDSCFESPTYQYDRVSYINMPVFHSATVVIDPRSSGAGDDLTGTLTITVTAGVNTTPQSPTGEAKRDNVAFKRIVMTVAWSEPQGPQSVTIEKTVTSLDL